MKLGISQTCMSLKEETESRVHSIMSSKDIYFGRLFCF